MKVKTCIISKISGGKISAAMNYFPNGVIMSNEIFHSRSNVVWIDQERDGYIFHTDSQCSKFVFVCFKYLMYSIKLWIS